MCSKYEKEKHNAIERGLEEEMTYPTFTKWVLCAIQEVQGEGLPMEDPDVRALCCPPTITILRCQ
jgi:hypothetical protein